MSIQAKARKRRALRLLAAVTLGAVLSMGGRYLYWDQMEHRFLTIAEGQLYRSGAIPPEQLQRTVLEHGIRTVVDLRRPGEEVERERAALAHVGVEHFHIPSGMVPAPDVVEAVLAVLDRRENRPVLIHCNHGRGRAVLFSAIYRMEYDGWSNERARSMAYWTSALGNFEPDSRKGLFLLNYVPRHARERAVRSRRGRADVPTPNG